MSLPAPADWPDENQAELRDDEAPPTAPSQTSASHDDRVLKKAIELLRGEARKAA